MSRNNVLWFSVLIMLQGISVATYARDTMRCGSNLITPGDTKHVVLGKCGEPKHIEVISSAIERNMEEWYYDFSMASFPQVLTFEGYRLISIHTISEQAR